MPETNNVPQNSSATHAKKRSSLGRGLGSLLGGAADMSVPDTQAVEPTRETQTKPLVTQVAESMSPNQVWIMPIDRLRANTQQPRQIFASGPLAELAASIKEKGILQPITAKRLDERNFEIIAGERRWRAAQIAGLHEVPVLLREVTDLDSLEYAIIENVQRENLNPMEEAEAYEHMLREYSLTQQQVADKLGKDRSTVANLLRLTSLSKELKEMVRSEQLSAGHAKVLLGLPDPTQQLQLAKQVIAKRLSVRATEKLAAEAKPVPADRVTTALDVDIPRRLVEGLSAELQKLIGTKVSIDYSHGKGKLQVHFYSDEQLSQLVEKMRRAWEN